MPGRVTILIKVNHTASGFPHPVYKFNRGGGEADYVLFAFVYGLSQATHADNKPAPGGKGPHTETLID